MQGPYHFVVKMWMCFFLALGSRTLGLMYALRAKQWYGTQRDLVKGDLKASGDQTDRQCNDRGVVDE